MIYQGKFRAGEEDFMEGVFYDETGEIYLIGDMRETCGHSFGETYGGKCFGFGSSGKKSDVLAGDCKVRQADGGVGKVKNFVAGAAEDEMKKGVYCPIF